MERPKTHSIECPFPEPLLPTLTTKGRHCRRPNQVEHCSLAQVSWTAGRFRDRAAPSWSPGEMQKSHWGQEASTINPQGKRFRRTRLRKVKLPWSSASCFLHRVAHLGKNTPGTLKDNQYQLRENLASAPTKAQ